MRKRLISVILTVVLLCTMGMGTHAMGTEIQSDTGIQPRYSYTDSTLVTLGIDNGTADCFAYIEGYKNITTKVSIEMTLQKKTLWWWNEVKTWSYSVYDYQTSIEEFISVDGGTYRVKATFTAYNGSANETVTDYSPEKSC